MKALEKRVEAWNRQTKELLRIPGKDIEAPSKDAHGSVVLLVGGPKAVQQRLLDRGPADYKGVLRDPEEEVGGLFGAGALQAHISGAIGAALRPTSHVKKLHSAVKQAAKEVESEVAAQTSALPSALGLTGELHLPFRCEFGERTAVEGDLRGLGVSIAEVQFKLRHSREQSLGQPRPVPCHLVASAVSDLGKRHRAAVEGSLGNEGDRNSLSTIVATDFVTRPSWGLAGCHKLGQHTSIFARASGDEYEGTKLFLQSVHQIRKHTLTPCYMHDLSGYTWPGAGFSWTYTLRPDGPKEEDALTLKAFADRGGNFDVSWKIDMGKV